MRKASVLLCGLLLVLAGCRGGLSSSERLEPIVEPRAQPELVMQHSYYASNDSLHLLLRFEDAKRVVNLPQVAFAYTYTIAAGGAGENNVLLRDSIEIPPQNGQANQDYLTARLVLPGYVVQSPHVLQLRIWQKLAGQERMGTSFRLPLSGGMLQKSYLLEDAASGQPLLQNYTTTSARLFARHFGPVSPDSIQVQRFESDFRPAVPPMSSRPTDAPRTLSATEVQTIAPSDTLPLQQAGIYLLNPGTAYTRGLLVLPGRFPEITRAEEMLQPLVYLTTSKERRELLAANDTKAAIDRFWLQLAGDEASARALIREFYNRVELANRLFSSHKAGWATDRGMLYIVYGQPSRVTESGDTLTWVYLGQQDRPYIKFVFTKKGNNFTENHYELIRRREYGESWYSTVAKWRAGKTNT
ncbi:GWxTD domain-containing protein [Pontibacter sp. E15-1]|uniref:GWxTD domain-containing protein n=1 Tax=Pontibacter sp. E15-1 TaxID=2919918 RepID=UPI001F4F170C|nr:GWxTD domain-containing protein [Pontibacter sp. E15-1]MCJ8164022.1 GWxTD domain-containing protein [Pontibacter sp. E15-1]